jgi:hypothetical protein
MRDSSTGRGYHALYQSPTLEAAEKPGFSPTHHKIVILRACDLILLLVGGAGGPGLPFETWGSRSGSQFISANLFEMFFFNTPQNRHPERSASQIYRPTQR